MNRVIIKTIWVGMLWLAVPVRGALPSPWQNQDIGNVGASGSCTYSNGVFTVNGSGADIWNTADEFHFVYQPYSGNVQIEVRVSSQTATDGWAKAGLMIRETLDSSSKHVMMIVTPSNGSSFQYRTAAGGISYHDTPFNGLTTPCRLKLLRVGNVFKGYSSSDGSNWTLISTVTISMSSTVYIGLCVTAHSDGQISTAVFDEVSVLTDTSAPTPDPAAWAESPHAAGPDTVQMTAAVGTDDSGPVDYYFEEMTGHAGGGDSGWISVPTYTDYGLQPMQTYTYRVRLRDAFGNTTDYSAPVSVRTGPTPDSDGDGQVTLSDFASFASNWLDMDCQGILWCGGSDFDLNGTVDKSDLELLGNAWLQPPAGGHFHGWATTPPMGWNSWDCFGTSVTEEEVKANADYMAQHLKPYGWEYVVVDIQWYEPQVEADPYQYPNPPHTNIDEYGRLWPAVNKHPSSANGKGFAPLAEYVHNLGLKFGVHLMRGIPKAAYNQNTPILGTPYTARDIADTSSTCSWNPDMYGVDTSKPGAQEYYNSVFNLLAQWGVDYVKVDDLSRPYHQGEIEAIRKAIDQCGRRMVFSTSPGATPLSSGEHISQHANLWRISDDFWDSWEALDSQFQRLSDWSQWNADGHFPDADMLPLGNIRARSGGWTNFTQTEQKTMMILWAIARSPLMMGGHMPNNDTYTLSLLTNSELFQVNQRSFHNRCIQSGNYPLWIADIPDSNELYLAVFNRTSSGPASVQVVLPQLEIKQSGRGIRRCRIRDLWTHTDLGEFTELFAPTVASHGAELYKITILETVPISEPEKRIALQNPGFDAQTLADGSWSAPGDILGWSDDSGGYSHAQNLNSQAIVPEAQSPENTCGLNQGSWIGQNLNYSDGSSVLIEAGKTYEVTVWAGRRAGIEGTYGGILEVSLEDSTSDTQIARGVYDLASQAKNTWTRQTLLLSTGNAPPGLGHPLRLVLKNIGTRAAEHWHAQIVLDDITINTK
ncbi:MAG TPA: hypothetical protein PK965_04345 [Anaerohalosphaeraceae bacterium]|nr:hypothetical protein [Anaerohalosphaeraceae bacterium]